MRNTRSIILDTAERLFAERGIRGVSVRAILTEAKLNVALAHYHFGSREGLIREVLRRRVVPCNEERLRLLNELEATSSPAGPTVEELLRAFFTPALRMLDETRHFARLAGHLHVTDDHALRFYYLSLFEPVLRRYSAAIKRALPPWVTDSERLCRGHFMIGAMTNVLVNHQDMVLMSRGRYDVPAGQGLVEELVTFCAAGLTARPREAIDAEPHRTEIGDGSHAEG